MALFRSRNRVGKIGKVFKAQDRLQKQIELAPTPLQKPRAQSRAEIRAVRMRAKQAATAEKLAFVRLKKEIAQGRWKIFRWTPILNMRERRLEKKSNIQMQKAFDAEQNVRRIKQAFASVESARQKSYETRVNFQREKARVVHEQYAAHVPTVQEKFRSALTESIQEYYTRFTPLIRQNEQQMHEKAVENALLLAGMTMEPRQRKVMIELIQRLQQALRKRNYPNATACIQQLSTMFDAAGNISTQTARA